MKRAFAGRALVSAGCFFLGLGAVGALLGFSLPLPEIEEVTAKIEHLRQHPAEYDTLFLGSSHIFHQVLPEQFDALTAAAGRPTHSFNLGIDALRPPEENYFVEKLLLPLRLRGVRHILVELDEVALGVAPERRETVRSMYWHDAPRLRLLWQAATTPRSRPKHFRLAWWLGRGERLWQVWQEHATPITRKLTSLGRGARWGEWLQGPPPPLYMGATGPRGDGFLEAHRPTLQGEAAAAYEQRLARRLRQPLTGEYGSPASQQAWRELLQDLRSLGAEVLLVLPPTNSARKFRLLPEVESRHVVLDYSDPARYPELYESRYRLDDDHLDTAGSTFFTRHLAEAFLAARP